MQLSRAAVVLSVAASACLGIPGPSNGNGPDGSITGDGRIVDGAPTGDGGHPRGPVQQDHLSLQMLCGSATTRTAGPGVGSNIGSDCDAIIHTDDYELIFARNSGMLRLPTRLTIGSASVLQDFGYVVTGSNGSSSTIDSQHPAPSSTLAVVLTGPAAVQLHMHSGDLATFACPSQPIVWDTDITAYPDGRIVRSDQTSGDTVPCGSSSSFELFNLAGTELSTLSVTGSAGSGSNTYVGTYGGCIGGSDPAGGPHVAFGYDGGQSVGGVRPDDSTIVSGGSNDTVMMSRFWSTIGFTPGASGVITYQVGSASTCSDELVAPEYLLSAMAAPVVSGFSPDGTRDAYTGVATNVNGATFDGVLPPLAINIAATQGAKLQQMLLGSDVVTEGSGYLTELVGANGLFVWFQGTGGISSEMTMTLTTP